MRGLAAGLFVWAACSAPLFGQERDRSLERISLVLEQPPAVLRHFDSLYDATPKKFGIFTLLPPTGRGEMFRLSIPIGELATRAFRSVAAAKRRRQEAAARREVEAALEWFKAQQPPPKP